MFKEHTKTVSIVGDPFEENTSHGPQVSKQQYDRVMEYVEKGKAEGAVLVAGGTPGPSGGNFVAPTMFKDVEVRIHAIQASDTALLIGTGTPPNLSGRGVWTFRCV